MRAEGPDKRPTQRDRRTLRPGHKRAYDEVRRQRPRASTVVAKVAYMDRGRRSRTGLKRNAIEMGVRALDRVVAQQYDWQDVGLGKDGRGWAYG